MKKLVMFAVVAALMVSVASVAYARTMEEEAQDVRNYLTVVDTKLTNAKQSRNTRRVELLHVEKAATLARWNKLKAEMEAAKAAEMVPAPVVVAPAIPAKRHMFGLNLNADLAAQFIGDGKNSTIYGLSGISSGLMGNLVLDDFIGLGPRVGMSADTVKFKLGTGIFYMYGTDGIRAVPLYAGGIINLPTWWGGQESYLTGGLNYVIYGNGRTSGRIGGDVYFGVTADLGLGLGKTGFEIGYNVVRSSTVTSKGLSFSVRQPLLL